MYKGNTLTWEKGRQLKNYGNTVYTYNASGIRISKKVNNELHSYILNGTNIIRESYGTTTLEYLYDKDNEVCGFTYNGAAYYYYKNLQGDVISITDCNGNIITNYHYDAWGKVIDMDGDLVIGNINPFRYRSYYYDTDTNLYYLNSRYYDAEICRFINADDVNMITAELFNLTKNLFTYSYNNPIIYFDKYGYCALRYPGEIHDFVSKRLVSYNRGLLREKYLTAKRGWKIMRSDLLMKQSSSWFMIWEIKPMSTSDRSAFRQIDNYIQNARYKESGRKYNLRHGTNKLKMMERDSYRDWYVWSFYQEKGIIRYYYINKREFNSQALQNALKTILVIGAMVLLIYAIIHCPWLIPALV